MQQDEGRSVLSISKFSISSEINSLVKLKSYQKGLVKGRCALKPIGDIKYSKSFMETDEPENIGLAQPSQLSLEFHK